MRPLRTDSQTAAGDSEPANDAHDVVAAMYRRLRERGEQRQLRPLLCSGDPAIVAWAGAHALTLSVWRDRELRFP